MIPLQQRDSGDIHTRITYLIIPEEKFGILFQDLGIMILIQDSWI